MRNKLVSYEMAILLKAKGFNDETHAYYVVSKNEAKVFRMPYPHKFNDFNGGEVSAPTTDDVLSWLREAKGIFISITYDGYGYHAKAVNLSNGEEYADIDEQDSDYWKVVVSAIDKVIGDIIK